MVVVALLVTLSVFSAGQVDRERTKFFEKKVRPLLVARCYECHSPDAKKVGGRLLLSSREGWEQGGERGLAIVAGEPERSLVIRAVRYEDKDLRMPPSGKLNAAEIATLVAWVKMGAPDPRSENAVARERRSIAVDRGRDFWAFEPPRRPAVPAVDDTSWPRTEIDRFLLARLESNGLKPVADADRRTVFRRAYFDLIGMPPRPDEVKAFVRDPAPDAFSKVVDRLLGSPHFGERWGRHWLDVARFAESSGGGRSLVFKNAWRYRDYVIDSFNNDKPFDRFVTEQIAGDLLPSANTEQRDEQVIATAYLVLGSINYELQDKELLRLEVVDEQIDTLGRTFLGLGLGCARCHDHKFDPIPTTDYYALAGILRSTRAVMHDDSVSTVVEQLLTTSSEHRSALDRHASAREKLNEEIQQAENKVKELEEEAGRAVSDTVASARSRVESLEGKLKALEKTAPAPAPTAMSVMDEENPEDSHVYIRGEARNLGPRVPRGFLTVLSRDGLGARPRIAPGTSGRLELASWLTSPSNPLTARVLVNRIWHHLVGAGLVRTTDDFGTMGERPSHPQLLDYLAIRFVEDGWSVKRAIRQILLSRVYQLSTRGHVASDPENRLVYRANRKRLEAECLRDSMLAISGQLDLTAGGLTIRKLTQYDVRYTFNTRRRSVYVPVFRNSLLELFRAFDFANPNLAVGQRNVSTLPTQALYFMNSPFVLQQSRHAAERFLAGARQDALGRIDQAYGLVLGRPPTKAERAMSLAYIRSFGLETKDSANTDGGLEAWASLFHALFASLDFRYVN